MAKIRQGPLKPPVAPRGILPRHPDRQRTNLLQDTRPTDPPSHGRPLASDQLPVPAENSIRRDERRHFRQRSPSEAMPRGREPPALWIREFRRCPPRCSLRTRFSSRRYAIISTCRRFTHPARATRRIRHRIESTIRRVYRDWRATEFSDSTS